ncbi:MAG: hypothetical protein FWE80_02450 [Oscillospiraceae bacterium]|nr:hypothetical protein [Oscillospiraceae bacterium]
MARVHVARPKKAKKKIAAIVAIVLTLALLIGGVFAWSDFGQRIQNIFNYAPTPDVLLHDDFTANVNKDVYVENTGVVPLYVRVQFAEFMQIGNDAYTNTGVKDDPDTWPVHLHGPDAPAADGLVSEWGLLHDPAKTDQYFDWYLTGSRKVYLQGTSEIADKTYAGSLVGTPGPNGQEYAYTMPATPVVLMSDVLRIKPLAEAGSIVADSADEAIWNAVLAGCWVLDDTDESGWDADGWAYWSQPLAPGTATNLLLDNVLPTTTPDDNMFYGIDVRLQVTNYTELHEFGDIPPLWGFVNGTKANTFYFPLNSDKQFAPDIYGYDSSWVWSMSPALPGVTITAGGKVSVPYDPANFGKTFTVKAVNPNNPNNYETWLCEVVLPLTPDYFPDEYFRTKFGAVTEDVRKIADEEEADPTFYTKAEADEVKDVGVNGAAGDILDITGIEHFVNLWRLFVEDYPIASMDLSKNTKLEVLHIYNNPNLITLDLSNNLEMRELQAGHSGLQALDLRINKKMTYIMVQDNALETLRLEGLTALTNLNASNNQLETLDVTTNTAMKEINLGGNQLETIDFSKNLALEEIKIDGNKLIALDLTVNRALKSVWCNDNGTIETLTLGTTANYYPALHMFRCDNNKVSSITLTGMPILRNLNVSSNRLTALNVSVNTALVEISCSGNQISSLNVSTNVALEELNIHTNNISVLNLTANTALKKITAWNNGMTTLTLGVSPNLTEIWCDNNSISTLDIRGTGIVSESATLVINDNGMETLYCKNGHTFTNPGNHTNGNMPGFVTADP